jgi:hypothetical protein
MEYGQHEEGRKCLIQTGAVYSINGAGFGDGELSGRLALAESEDIAIAVQILVSGFSAGANIKSSYGEPGPTQDPRPGAN